MAPCTTAPVASVNSPLTVPKYACAHSIDGSTSAIAMNETTSTDCEKWGANNKGAHLTLLEFTRTGIDGLLARLSPPSYTKLALRASPSITQKTI